MNIVTFVSGLRTELVRCYEGTEIRYRELEHPRPVSDYKLLDLTAPIQTRVATVHQICGVGREDVYVAYSREVEKVLGIPIRCIVKEKNTAVAESKRYRDRLRTISGLSFWQRLVFLLTKKLPSVVVKS